MPGGLPLNHGAPERLPSGVREIPLDHIQRSAKQDRGFGTITFGNAGGGIVAGQLLEPLNRRRATSANRLAVAAAKKIDQLIARHDAQPASKRCVGFVVAEDFKPLEYHAPNVLK